MLFKSQFSTLISIVKHLGILDEDRTVRLANILDRCVIAHLKKGSFTGHQVLLIYKEFPNDLRPSHSKLYFVFKDLMKGKSLSPEHFLELSKILDYNKLTDEIVQKLWEEFGLGWKEPRLQGRVIEIQQVKATKTYLEMQKLRSELDQKTVELVVKRDVEIELARVLEREKDMTTCKICFERPRDSMCLPCKHFQFCSECLQQHHGRDKACPTCEFPQVVSEVLQGAEIGRHLREPMYSQAHNFILKNSECMEEWWKNTIQTLIACYVG